MATLRLEGIEKRYVGRFKRADVWPVQTFSLGPINLELADGECFVLFGDADSGKTTLSKLISGQIAPTSGDIWLGEHLVTNVPQYERGIGAISEQPLLMEQLSIEDNVAFGLKLRHVHGRLRSRLSREMLRSVGAIASASHSPSGISYTQQLRVSFAQALVLKPSLLLIDDPFSTLDHTLRREMQRLFKRLHAEFTCTTLFLTQNMQEATAIGDRVGVMDNGRLTQTGNL